jgi:hypothetical protein
VSAVFVDDRIVFVGRHLRNADGRLTRRDEEGNPVDPPELFSVRTDGSELRSLGAGYYSVDR